MLITIIFTILFVAVNTIQIPFINNVTFISISNSSSIMITNQTCDQCLCLSNSSYMALNCFPNNTCQFFYTFPRTYTLQSTSQARLYFLQQIFPNTSQCCISNTSYLLNKLNTTTPIITQVFSPRCLVLDNNGYIVTISQQNWTIVRLYATNLTVVEYPSPPTFYMTPMTITYRSEAYYVGFDAYILVLDSNNFTELNNITTLSLSGTRGMIFLNDGQTFVVASTYNQYILFFNRSNTVSQSYTFVGQQYVNYSYPHGLWYISDTFFYVTSWGDNTIYSYSATNVNTIWTQNLFLDPKSVATTSDGNHLTIDECNRYWYSLGSNGMTIFNNQGLLVANFTEIIPSPFDALITDEYVIYLSDTSSNIIKRIDPEIQYS